MILALRDYRRQTGHFDKIVSVGMLEHVGPGNFGTYFRKVRELLNANGITVIRSIGVHASQSLAPENYFPGRLSAITRPDGRGARNAGAGNT